MAEVRKLHANIHFPDEILGEIFLKLPVRSLLLFKLVCKHWLRLIKNSHFTKMHINRPIDNCHDHNPILVAHAINQYKIVLTLLSDDELLSYEEELPLEFMSRSMGSDIFNLDRVHLLGPCNGLFCLTDRREIVVFNPVIRRCRNVSRSCSNRYAFSFLSSVCVGFGYDRVSDDYKVVRFDEDVNNNVYNHDVWDDYGHDAFKDDDLINGYNDYDDGDYFDCKVNDYSDNDSASSGDYHVGMDTYCDVDGHDYDVGDNNDYDVGDNNDYEVGDDDYDIGDDDNEYDGDFHDVHFRVEIYSLRNDSWRVLDCILPPGNISGNHRLSLFLNGALHWLHASSILVFDLNEEAFKWFDLANTCTEGDDVHVYLSVFNDSLAMIVHRKFDHLDMIVEFEIWVMMKYGIRSSWRKLYNISPDIGIERPLSFSKKDEFLIEIRYGKSAMGYGKLASFNFKTKAIKLFNIEACMFMSFNSGSNPSHIPWAPGLVNAFQFRESLVSLK